MNFPSENDMTLNLNKFECLVPSLAQCSWKEDFWFFTIGFLIIVNESSLFRYYQLLGTGLVLHLNILEVLSPLMS